MRHICYLGPWSRFALRLDTKTGEVVVFDAETGLPDTAVAQEVARRSTEAEAHEYVRLVLEREGVAPEPAA